MSHHVPASTRSLSAMFDTRDAADRAVAALEAAGIAQVSVTGGEASHAHHEDRGFFEALGDFFFPEEDRHVYAEGLKRGSYLVTVSDVAAGDVERALDILDDEGAVDLSARESEWRAEGWDYRKDPAMPVATGIGAAGAMREPAMTAPAAERVYDEADLNRDGVIDVVEEQMHIAKREADLGRVRVRSYVREVPVEETVSLREERVNVERRPVDRAATDADFRDQTVEAREYAEKAVVSKEARVVEEIALTKDVQHRDEVVRDTLRKTEVEVEDDRELVRDPA